MKRSSMNETTRAERDDAFYSESLVLKVGNTLFSVPKTGLVQQGTYFEKLLQERPSSSTELETVQDIDNACDDAKLGSSDESPIVLEGVCKEEFKDFLCVIFPFRHVMAPNSDEQWLNVLRLSRMWGFPLVSIDAAFKLRHIFEGDPIESIALSIKYDIKDWLVSSYEKVITRNAPLDWKKMRKAGINEETTTLLCTLRDMWLTKCLWGRTEGEGKEGKGLAKTAARDLIEDYLAGIYDDQDEEVDDMIVETSGDSIKEDDHQQVEISVVIADAADIDMHSDDMVISEQDAETIREVMAADAEDGDSHSTVALDNVDDTDSEASQDEDAFEQEDAKFHDDSRTDAIALHELYNKFKGLVTIPPKKKNGAIDASDVLHCIRCYINSYDSTSSALVRVAKILFERALEDPTCSELYADLCDDIVKEWDKFFLSDPNKGHKSIRGGSFFCRELYVYWHRAFNDRIRDTRAERPGSLAHLRSKQRRLALVKFMGEWFLFYRILGKGMGMFVEDLVKSGLRNKDEVDIKALCYLLPLIGDRFDSGNTRHHTNCYFEWMKGLVRDEAIPKRLRDMVKDVLQLRDRGWRAPPRSIRKWLPLK